MEIAGTVKSIIYRNEQNGYTVMEVSDESGIDIICIGALPLTSAGERIKAEGDWTSHPKYGRQFKIDNITLMAPSGTDALIKYLGSGLIKGVGEVTANAIVNTFGADTLVIMEQEPDRLTEIPGIGARKAAVIAHSFQQNKAMRDIMLALGEYGITISQTIKLHKIYGDMCLIKVRENPYQLIEDVETIGFKTADRIAQNVGIEKDSPERIKAGITYTLQYAQREGHTYLPKEILLDAAQRLLEADILPVERALAELIITNKLAEKIIDNGECLFLPYMFYYENDCARRLSLLINNRPAALFADIRQEIEQLQEWLSIQLAPQQKQAVITALNSGVMVITGGPGTGKTTILKFIITLLERLDMEFELCAPTGRAAKRMSEASGKEAKTIHRLLEYGYGDEDEFIKNEDNPIHTDVIIIDEMSMVDIRLMHALMRAVLPGTRIIMVGDADQLPPVGAGNVLREVIKSDTVPVIYLTEIFRQAERSMIVTNAHRINRGIEPMLHEGDDFLFEEIENVDEVLKRVIALCAGKTDRLFARDFFKDIQVFSPMKKGTLGVKNLNAALQAHLNPRAAKKREKQYGDTLFREGDKVMQIKNNYRMEWSRQQKDAPRETGTAILNGDLGTVMRIDDENQELYVLFDDERYAKYEFSQLEELELAYCMSIHKSQGSEFPVVILPLVGGPPMLFTRNLLYTAITRARYQVYIVGSSFCISNMVKNNQTKTRYSALSTLLLNFVRMWDQ